MSLVTLNSLQQDPANFSNHLPQPLVLGKRSQVCLLRLTHFREKTRYVVSSDNNGLAFMIGTPPDNAVRVASVKIGAYTGAELALEVATALNNACLQQQWVWTCTFTAATATDDDQFECTATLAAGAPAAMGGLWTGPASDYAITGDPTDATVTITSVNVAPRSDQPCLLKRGIFGLDGGLAVYRIDPRADDVTFGLVREGLSSSYATNPEMRFDKDNSDFMVDISVNDGLYIGYLEEQGVIGEPAWRRQVWDRHIPAVTLLTICPVGSILGVSIAAHPTNSQYTVQLFVSADNGGTWTAVANAFGGNDPRGNPYVKTFDGNAGYVFLSNDPTTYDDEVITVNLFKTKYFPLLPYFVQNSVAAKAYAVAVVQNPVTRAGPPIEGSLPHDTTLVHRDLPSGGTFTNSAGGTSTFANHYNTAEYKEMRQTSLTSHLNLPSGNTWTQNIGSNTESFDTTNLGSVATYRRVSSGGYVHWWEATSATGWNIYFTQPVSGSVPDNTAVADLATGILTFAGGGTQFTPAQMPSTVPATSEHFWKKVTDSLWHIFNAQPTASSVPAFTATIDHQTSVLTVSDGSTKTPATALQKVDSSGPTLQTGNRQVTMLFNRLDNADRQNFAGAWTNPVDLLTNHGGTLGGTLGYPAFQQNNAAGTQVFTSDQRPIKVSNTSTLHVSIPELQGLVSYDGARADVGKTIAVLTRGEFGDEAVDGTQTHVAPHQNWLNIKNAAPLALNQLSVQLRDDSGLIIQDLDPETSLTVKFRQDPIFKQQEHTQHLLQAMQRQQAQPMMEVQNVGS